MKSSFLGALAEHMRTNGETVAILDVKGQKRPVVIEYVPRPDSERVHSQFRLLDQANAQQPHATN